MVKRTKDMWLTSKLFHAAPTHVKNAQAVALNLTYTKSKIPAVISSLVSWYFDKSPAGKEGLTEDGWTITRHDDTAAHHTVYHIDTQSAFSFQERVLVHVLRNKRDSPSPRLRFTLGGSDTPGARSRLNGYAVLFGVKFYCWRHKGVTWSLWVHDGTVSYAPISATDSVIATPT